MDLKDILGWPKPTDFKNSFELHSFVSGIPTPSDYVYQLPKGNRPLDYVKLDWMQFVADWFYPCWTFNIVEQKVVEDGGKPVGVYVAGNLQWLEVFGGNEYYRSISAVSGSNIKYRSNAMMGIEDDFKSAGTDLLKKLFSVGGNISDDIYQRRSPITPQWYEPIMEVIKELPQEDQIKAIEKIKRLIINSTNARATYKALAEKTLKKEPHDE